jgi:esterase/lipase
MLHGLSDSPYSLRALSERLHEKGAHVVGLRLPGHGTAPSGLDHVKWQDLTAAVRLAARDLSRKIGPDRPFYITGYSNGASLALEYTLSVLEGEDRRMPDGLILLSPAVGITPVAALAKWNLRISYLPWLEKMGWNSVQPEFDPYKYNSFAINAGDQIYRLLRRVRTQMKRLDPKGKGIEGFPPVLAFQSIADATVVTDAVVNNLMRRLAPYNHHLVLFDVNRMSETADYFARDTNSLIDSLFKTPLSFDLTLITNKDPSSREVIARHKTSESDSEKVNKTGLSWPRGIYSLSHVAIPFSPEDPLYGTRSEEEGRLWTLGSLEPRGERALLQVPVESLMRLRYNPFYSYVEETVFERLGAQVENPRRAHVSHSP